MMMMRIASAIKAPPPRLCNMSHMPQTLLVLHRYDDEDNNDDDGDDDDDDRNDSPSARLQKSSDEIKRLSWVWTVTRKTK